jgi:enoyl-CoA hydratase
MVQGYCIMGGWMLASVCDIIIASEDAKFNDRSVRWGLAHVQFFMFPWDIGPRKAKEYLWAGDFIDAEEAYRLGMVNRVVARDRLEEETMALAKKIALCPSDALRASKASINQQMDIMGQSAAIVASYNIGSMMQALRTNGEPPGGVQSARERDKAYKD